ncbi:MAG: Protein GrpE [Chroococcopsis gigantea SAG 12.99]|jgi:molecular chaperone GrpE|nr:Protein GrpE [Chroococcopsis gigantea SAG 12.99]
MLQLDNEQRESLIEKLGNLLKDKTQLQQALTESVITNQAGKEELFIELLEVFDALESLIDYVKDNGEVNSGSLKRLPKSLTAVQKKLLTVLERRGVTVIQLEESQPDFKTCQVVDREIRDDIEDNTITKVVRQGFNIGEKILRPVEVITSQKP